jgi:hypothetical protein
MLLTEAFNMFKDRWKTKPGDNYSGDRWSVAIIKDENDGIHIGPSEKKTHVYVVVLDKDGKVQEKEYDACSLSWVDNLHKIYPKINSWVQLNTGVNPNLA